MGSFSSPIFTMEDKPIIDKKRMESLRKLIDSGSEENINLAVNIVENCDIEKSFPMILKVIASSPMEKYTMNTPFTRSLTFFSYVSALIHNKMEMVPIQHDLDFIIDLWERHHKIQIIQEDIRVRKELILAYKSEKLVKSFKPNLNPKKNVRK